MPDLLEARLHGIREDMPAKEYHAAPGASNSRLSKLLRSPAHLRAADLNPEEATPDMVLGTALHALVLEPETFAAGFVRGVEGDGRTKAVKEARERLEMEHPGATILKPEHWESAHRMRDAIFDHPAASALLSGEGTNELSFFWSDPDTGVLCKGRADRVKAARVIDIKTTDDASPEAFARTIFTRGYHRQGAHYRDGLAANGVEVKHHILIVPEKKPPYAVAVYRVMDDALAAGRTQLRSLLSTYRWCMETGEWPGYSPRVEDISIPRWSWSSIESEV